MDDLHEKYHECLEMLMENQVSNKHVNRILQQGFTHLCPLGIQGLGSCCVLVNYYLRMVKAKYFSWIKWKAGRVVSVCLFLQIIFVQLVVLPS